MIFGILVYIYIYSVHHKQKILKNMRDLKFDLKGWNLIDFVFLIGLEKRRLIIC